MKAFKRAISRRLFLKGGIFSTLAAMGFIMGCGSGRLNLPGEAPIEEAGETPIMEGDGPVNAPAKDTDSDAVWVQVWKADPLYDAATGEKIPYMHPTDANKRVPESVFKKLQSLCDRFLFLKSVEDGLNNRKALRQLNFAFKQAVAGLPMTWVPQLRPVYIRKDILDLLSYGSNYIDLYTPHFQNHLVKALYSFKSSEAYEQFMKWTE